MHKLWKHKQPPRTPHHPTQTRRRRHTQQPNHTMPTMPQPNRSKRKKQRMSEPTDIPCLDRYCQKPATTLRGEINSLSYCEFHAAEYDLAETYRERKRKLVQQLNKEWAIDHNQLQQQHNQTESGE